MKRFLIDLGIILPGEYDDRGNYIVEIPNSDEFSKIFSTLEKAIPVIETDSSQGFSNGSINYESTDYLILLTYDFDQDIYRLVCSLR